MTILQHAFGYANILRLFAKQMKNGEKDLLDFMKHGSEGYMGMIMSLFWRFFSRKSYKGYSLLLLLELDYRTELVPPLK